MSNPVLILARNNLALTRRAVASVLYQDIPVEILIVDNDSTDGTWHWLQDQPKNVHAVPFRPQLGVSKGWNWGLTELFEFGKAKHVLVLGNDTEIPRWFYRELLSYNQPFVTGVAVDDRRASEAPNPAPKSPLQNAPDFSAYLIRKDAYTALLDPAKGTLFDERMVLYVQDCDLHVRGHRLGIPMLKANVPFYHERSSTMNNASQEEREAISARANADRDVFRSLYGCVPGEEAYTALFLQTTP